MTKIKALPGEHISEVAQRAVDAVAAGEPFVSFDFNDIVLTVNRGETVADVVAKYSRESEERHERYVNSDEYKQRQREAEEHERQRTASLDAALKVAPDKPTWRDPAAWQSFVEANTSGYGGACVTYAERWARIMEGAIGQGATVAGCAKEMSHVADSEGITGFMYGAAVSILAKAWQHGEELRRWHNLDTQIGNEGEKANESGEVINPALLTIGEP